MLSDEPQEEAIDDVSAAVKRIDVMYDQLVELTALFKEAAKTQGNTNTVIHRTEGMGTIGIVCATVCVCCVLFLILGAILIVPDVHDLRAWNDINRKDIARLQAQQQQLEKR